ncbi:MAG: hypothetical protein WAU36_15060 [Cyclobacteriaceae bacterium]
MKKVFIVALISCFGCLSEKNLDPGTSDTFIKYFNGGFDDTAQDIKATADGGYILLATTAVRPDEVTAERFKIKLVKTDAFGNLIWQKVYPEYDPDVNATSPIDSASFRGRSIMILKDGAGLESGYVVVGDSIQNEAAAESHLRIMVTDLDGNTTLARNFKPNFAVQGKAVAANQSGNFVVLGEAVNTQTTNNMFLAELDQNLGVIWTRTYGAGASNLANRLFVNAQSSLFWSGTVTKNNRSDIRFVKTPHNSENTEFDLPFGSPQFNETGRDICSYGFGFAVIGTTDESGDDDILFKRLSENGTELSTMTFGFPGQAENGFSICQARDGGLILLGAVDTNLDIGRGGKDYFLIKINAFGDTEWTQIFGSKNDDIGASVLANADGSYVIYGTTVWGGLKTLSLIKTDAKGNIE